MMTDEEIEREVAEIEEQVFDGLFAEEVKAEYETRNGKHFLKINGEYVEVEIAKVKDGFRVMPVNS